jgi:hypothetical protein
MVWSIINILLTAGFGYISINAIKKGSGTDEEKKIKVQAQLKKVCDSMQAYAKKTDASWDDSLVEVFSGQLEAMAELILADLG